jgi:hypothetical protein
MPSGCMRLLPAGNMYLFCFLMDLSVKYRINLYEVRCQGVGDQGMGSGVRGSGFGDHSLGTRVRGSEFLRCRVRDRGSGFGGLGVPGLGFRVQGSGLIVEGVRLNVRGKGLMR